MSTSALIARREWHPLLANLARSLNRVTSLVAPPPSSPGTRQHKVVVIHVHPYGNQPSFTLALTKTVRESLEDAGGKPSFLFIPLNHESNCCAVQRSVGKSLAVYTGCGYLSTVTPTRHWS